jgi:DNA adenine methylase
MLFENILPDKLIVPPIKCQGIKTDLVKWIETKIQNYDVWYEPFCGSCVVGFNIKPKKAIFGDNNPHLINFYQSIKDKKITHLIAKEFLEQEGNILLESNGEHYYVVRERFNKLKNPLDFLFLNRACFNGLIRFNSKGGFNTPFCRKPNRFAKSYITKICNQIASVSEIINNNDYNFVYQDFSETIKLATENDLIYCDPPYIMRSSDYFTSWNLENEKTLCETLTQSKAKFILSTWHSNEYRTNEAIQTIWNKFQLITREHFYFIGGSENNRNSMLEALIMN